MSSDVPRARVAGWCVALSAAWLSSVAACGDLEPRFISVLDLRDTRDTVGPYVVVAHSDTPRGVARLTLRLTDEPQDGRFADLTAVQRDGDEFAGRWELAVPGRPVGTKLAYYLVLIDTEGEAARHPAKAPSELVSFNVLP